MKNNKKLNSQNLISINHTKKVKCLHLELLNIHNKIVK